MGGYTYSWWPNGELNQADTFQANYDEFGKLMLANITATPGTIDPNDAEFMGEDALDHIYFHGRATTAGDTHPFIYHSTDGLRPETILEWQCLQTGGGVPTCTGTGTGTRLYVLGPDPDERWAFINASGTTYDPHTDREGTLIALANRGAASQIYTWDAYGQNSAPSNDAGQGPPGYLYRYTGQRFDPNTSLYDYKARTYSPVLGRFLQPDPKGIDQGPNLYGYVGDDPIDHGDPTGRTDVNFFPTEPDHDLYENAEDFNPSGYTTAAGHGNVGFLRDNTIAEKPDYGVSRGAFPIGEIFTSNQLKSLKTLMFLSCNAGSSINNGTVGLAQSAAISFGRFSIGSTGHIYSQNEGFLGANVSFVSRTQGANAGAFNAYAPNGAKINGISVKSITYNKFTGHISFDGKDSVSGTYKVTGSSIPVKATCDQKGCH